MQSIKLEFRIKLATLMASLIMLCNESIAASVTKSDILLHIVSQCVDSSKIDCCANCMLPRVDAMCSASTECKKTNEVWALSAKYAAIRDIKMCGCQAGFIHGLTMPRDVVTGVEDDRREEDIWQFAWDVGVDRIELESLALVVNPQSERTQNQLHVHMLRLEKNARENFAKYSHAYVQSLNQVWSSARKMAVASGLSDYGVLVAKESAMQYIVVIVRHSPEDIFTIWNCGN